MYVLDGEYVFDYAAAAVTFMGNDFGFLPEMIVVGVPNTDRLRDFYVTYEPNAGYLNFLDFLKNELKPFVEKTYNTNGFDLFYGWSSGSSIGTYLLGSDHKLFDAYILSGTGIGSRTDSLWRARMPGKDYLNTFLYATTESDGPRLKSLRKLENTLVELEPRGLNWQVTVPPNSGHVEMLSRGLYEGLSYVFNDFYLSEEQVMGGSKEILKYFKSLNEKYGYEVIIPKGVFIEAVSTILYKDMFEESIQLLEIGIKTYPSEQGLFGALGEVYQVMGDIKKAREAYTTARSLAVNNPADYQKYHVILEALKSK